MWICGKCQTENEQNFNYCWSCGKPPATDKAVKSSTGWVVEPPASPRPVGADAVEERKPDPEKLDGPNTAESRPADQVAHPQKIREPEIFSTFIPEVERASTSADDNPDREREIFTAGVRLLGLVFLFLFITGIPDLAEPFYMVFLKPVSSDSGVLDSFTVNLLKPVATLLFYLITGVYLIASGRILLWLLPRA